MNIAANSTERTLVASIPASHCRLDEGGAVFRYQRIDASLAAQIGLRPRLDPGNTAGQLHFRIPRNYPYDIILAVLSANDRSSTVTPTGIDPLPPGCELQAVVASDRSGFGESGRDVGKDVVRLPTL